jgi:hypothetical protein
MKLVKKHKRNPEKKRTLKLNVRRELSDSLAVTTMALQHHHNFEKKNLRKKKEEKGSSRPTWFGGSL